jgi:hypothetical protein
MNILLKALVWSYQTVFSSAMVYVSLALLVIWFIPDCIEKYANKLNKPMVKKVGTYLIDRVKILFSAMKKIMRPNTKLRHSKASIFADVGVVSYYYAVAAACFIYAMFFAIASMQGTEISLLVRSLGIALFFTYVYASRFFLTMAREERIALNKSWLKLTGSNWLRNSRRSD